MIASLLLTTLAAAGPAPAALPHGVAVEARTASVFAGACHFNGELCTSGRAALVGWHFEGGAYDGADLAGLDLAVLVDSTDNLIAEDAPRASVVFLDRTASPAARAAGLAWLRAKHGALVGDVRRVVVDDVDVAREGESFHVLAGPHARLDGTLMPDRACCSMPLMVLYTPLSGASDRIVGCTRTFQVESPALGRRWSRPGENSVFVGRFGAPATE